jgi:S-adenosylmethionine decarboxylase
MRGLHLTADLYQCRCDAAWLTDAQQLGQWCRQAVEAVGLEPVAELFRSSPQHGSGVNATVLLPASHVCLHTFAARKSVSVDVYVCHDGEDHSAQARGLMDALVNRFAPEWTEQRSLDRGDGE